jgi:hypothetical protein
VLQVEQGSDRAGRPDLAIGDQRRNLVQREPLDPLGLERGLRLAAVRGPLRPVDVVHRIAPGAAPLASRIETYLVIEAVAMYATDIS